MKILMLAPEPFFEPRGTPLSVLGRLRALSELGHEIDLLTYHVGQNITIPKVRIHRTPRIGFIRAVKIGPSAVKLVLDILLWLKASRMLQQNRYDVLHTHEEASFVGILLARHFHLPHIYDMHSSLPQQLSNFRYTRFPPILWFFKWFEQRVIRSSDAIITICPALEEHVRKVGNGAVKEIMIENLASDSEADAHPDLPAAYEDLPHGGERKIVLYAGTLEAYQGIELLIHAAAILLPKRKDVLFVIIGGKTQQVRHYLRMINALGLSNHFILTGARSPSEVSAAARQSDILVSPRIDGTNTPLKIYSYLRWAKPIVATNTCTHTQVLNPDVALLADKNPNALASALLTLLDDPQLGERLGANARKLYEARYSHGQFVAKIDDVMHMAMS